MALRAHGAVERVTELADVGAQQTLLPARSRFAVVDAALQAILVVALLGELAVVFLTTVGRSLVGLSAAWTPEATQLAISVIAFLGGALAYRRGEHAFIRTLIDALPSAPRRACYAVVEFLVLTVAAALVASALPLFATQARETTAILHLNVTLFIVPLVIAAAVLALTAAERLAVLPRATVLRVGAVFAAAAILLVFTHDRWQAWFGTESALGLALGLFVASVAIGLPVGFALLLGAFAYTAASDSAPMPILAQTMVSGVNSFVLLALPFFIFAAIIMNQGGISLRLVRLVQACVGHFRGGLFQVLIVSMYVVSGLSGSKMADVAAVGSVMRDILRREGYSLDRSAAILCASAAMGEAIPPSVAILILGAVTTLSMGTLFLAGIIPAAVIALCLMTLVLVQSVRTGAPRAPRVSRREFTRATLGGILPLLMPAMLFGGILFGIATPTEVSSFAVVYGLLLAVAVYRELGWKRFVNAAVDAASTSGMVLFIIAAASGFAWTLTVANLPHHLVELLAAAHPSSALFLLGAIVLVIVTGSVLEGLPSLLILAPILMPIAVSLGVSPIHFAIVLVIAMGIGFFIPPIGIGFYITCAICEASIERSSREMIPYLIVLCIGLILVALVPWFTLVLPSALHLIG